MNTPRQIMIVDSNPNARRDLARDLTGLGYAVMQVGSAAEADARALFLAAQIDLIILDTVLEDGDGLDLVARLRGRGVGIPIILLSAFATEDHVVRGLDAGADDYIVRPPPPREFAARIRAQFRIAMTPDAGDIRIGPVIYRPGDRTVLCPGRGSRTRLTEKEAALLLRLCSAGGLPVSRQTLLREVWGYSASVSSHTVETHVYRLRRKIEPGDGQDLLVNEAGGYRLCLSGTPDTASAAVGPSGTWTMPGLRHRALAQAVAAG